jgi:uncharacterized cofD-like protein
VLIAYSLRLIAEKMKNIVIIGGGTGTFTLLSGLRKYPSNNSVIVSSADDGGSTGVLRRELGVMPPGDIRQCLVGLSYTQKEMRELFNFRFNKGSLAGHSVGNIILAALEKIAGTEEAINLAGKMLNVRGKVLPVTLTPTTLSAVLQNGKKIVGEHYIDDPFSAKATKGRQSPIKSLHLTLAKANPKALKALEQADAIIFGPGDLFTSILPNLLPKGVAEAVRKSKAKKVLITNIMTKFGQTDGFKASDFVKVLQSYLGGNIDIAIVNSKKPAFGVLRRYAKEKAVFVEPDVKKTLKSGIRTATTDLLCDDVYKKASGDILKRSMLRHDPDKLAKIIWQLIN